MYGGFHRIVCVETLEIHEKYEWRHVLLLLASLWPDYAIIDNDDDGPIIIVVDGKIVAKVTFVDENGQ